MQLLGFGEHRIDLDATAKSLGFVKGMPFDAAWPIICKVAALDGGAGWDDPLSPRLTEPTTITSDFGTEVRQPLREEYAELYAQGLSFTEMFNMMYEGKMTIQLTVFPLDICEIRECSKVRSRRELYFEREYPCLWHGLKGASIPVPFPLYMSEGMCLTPQQLTPNGDRLSYVTAHEFGEVRSRTLMRRADFYEFDWAAIKYIAHLPPDTMIILWWH